ncbi:MAG TPA: septum formation initiator family protein [Aestuariivirgaceae bacterium]|jgi:cell division protein FtsB|nr:septum formation initiator family protein [Aestuariivirgaceae bacterium]
MLAIASEMKGMRNMRLRAFDIAVTVGSLGLLGYFGWHGLHGPRSFANEAAIEAEVARLEDELAKVSAERAARDARVALLRPQSIDPDLLDEIARRSLGYVRESEIVLEIAPAKAK